MSAELLLNVTPSETRVALIENGVLQELHIERQAKLGAGITREKEAELLKAWHARKG